MNDPRDLVAELHGLRAEHAALVARIAPLGRYSSLRGELCRKAARLMRRMLEIEVTLRRVETPPAHHEDDRAVLAAPPPADPYGGRTPYWLV